LLRIRGGEAVVPPELKPGKRCVVFRLGVRVGGTKAKREQYAILWEERDPDIFELMCKLIDATATGHPFFPLSIDQYRRLLRNVQAFLQLDLDIGPHSFRASFVVDAIVSGRDRNVIREEGRWASESSFKVYADIVGSLAVAAQTAAAGLLPAQKFALGHLAEYWPAFPPSCSDDGADQGVAADRRGVLHTGRGGGPGAGAGKPSRHRSSVGFTWRRYAKSAGVPTAASGCAASGDAGASSSGDA
jgi:hypothetical protein